MDFSRKLPIGIQSFEKLRRNNYLYIDKTTFAWDLIQGSNPYFLSRPRRFGKSLFLSTLAAYFLGQKELFKGLYLEKAEEAQATQEQRTAWLQYPVFYFDFNTGQYDLKDALNERLHVLLKDAETQYGIMPTKEEQPFFSSRFERLIKTVYQQTGKQAVILVDEYDKPLLQTMSVNEPLNEQYRNTLKAFYSVIEKHPFLDGNKRIGVHLMLIFLKINGIDLNDSQEELIDFGLKIASGKMKKDEINVILAALQSNKEV